MRRNHFFLFLLIALLLACQISEEDKIRQVLQRRQEALKNKDLSLYLSCISKAYQDKEENWDRLQTRIATYFQGFDGIEYQAWDLSIDREGNTAVITQRFRLEVEKAGKKNQYDGREALFFQKEGKDWKIVKGL
jgi:ketosteroid isomerase-like protein